ncbi:MAG: hypothetical protein Ct9H90mP9_5960 [Pseudomonadota bacterium]|nr:MAG: hypothetical protein Ct9H90mP9_5960 [Pseudomonadota bacterium]
MDPGKYLKFLPHGEAQKNQAGSGPGPRKQSFPRWLFPIEENTSGGGFRSRILPPTPGFPSFYAEVDAIHRFDQRNILLKKNPSEIGKCIFNPRTSKGIFCRWIRQWFSLFFELQNLFFSAMFLDQFFSSQQAVMCPLATCSRAG